MSESEGPRAEERQPTDQVERPSPRLIRSPRDAEEAAANWCRWLGFADAELTQAGSDGGADVRGRSLVAQVKAHMVPIGRPDLQKLHGVATAERAVSLFFSLMAYTQEAQAWADQVGMALFRFNHAGEAEPVNEYAKVMFDRAEHQEPRPAEPAPPIWSFPIGCTDQAAYQQLRPRWSGFRQPDQVLWVRQGWLPFASLRYDYSYVAPAGGRSEQHFSQTRMAIELQARHAIAMPQSAGNMVLLPHKQMTVEPRWTSAEVAGDVNDLWWRYVGGASAEWYNLELHGVPRGARTLRVTDEGICLLPFFAALIGGPAGNRLAVVEAVTGQVHPVLSSVFTEFAPYLIDELSAARLVEPSLTASISRSPCLGRLSWRRFAMASPA